MTNDLKTYDLVVIGGGPAGLTAATEASSFGKSVALVDSHQEIGGAGINTGTVPSKTLRETALALSGLKSRNLYGVDLSLRREVTVADFLHHEEHVKDAFHASFTQRLQVLKATIYYGTSAPFSTRIRSRSIWVRKIGRKILPPSVYAAGDVIGFPALASTSMEQARRAVRHALGLAGSAISPLLPNGIYTIPEVSMVGETEESLKKKGVAYIVGRANYRENARGRIIGDLDGFLKLLFRQDDLKLIGVHIMGDLATDVVHIGLVAMMCK